MIVYGQMPGFNTVVDTSGAYLENLFWMPRENMVHGIDKQSTLLCGRSEDPIVRH